MQQSSTVALQSLIQEIPATDKLDDLRRDELKKIYIILLAPLIYSLMKFSTPSDTAKLVTYRERILYRLQLVQLYQK